MYRIKDSTRESKSTSNSDILSPSPLDHIPFTSPPSSSPPSPHPLTTPHLNPTTSTTTTITNTSILFPSSTSTSTQPQPHKCPTFLKSHLEEVFRDIPCDEVGGPVEGARIGGVAMLCHFPNRFLVSSR